MIPHMTYPQYRAVRRLVHSCCNHQDGNCKVGTVTLLELLPLSRRNLVQFLADRLILLILRPPHGRESIMDFLFQARQDTAPTSQYARVKALKENVALFNFLQANGISSMP